MRSAGRANARRLPAGVAASGRHQRAAVMASLRRARARSGGFSRKPTCCASLSAALRTRRSKRRVDDASASRPRDQRPAESSARTIGAELLGHHAPRLVGILSDPVRQLAVRRDEAPRQVALLLQELARSTTRTVVTASFSSTSTLPPASRSSRDTHGSTVHTASSCLRWNSASWSGFCVGTTWASPPVCVILQAAAHQPGARGDVLRVAELRRRDVSCRGSQPPSSARCRPARRAPSRRSPRRRRRGPLRRASGHRR